jgi:RNA polymerase sigma-70 factor (ECF subfamily)
MNSSVEEIQKLIPAIQNGSQEAFSRLYDLYAPVLLGIIMNSIKDNETSENILKTSFVKIFKEIKKYDSSKYSFFIWMHKLVRDEILNFKHGNDFNNSIADAEDLAFQGISENKMQDSNKAIKLYFKGFSAFQTADALKIPLTNVKMFIRSGLKDLGGSSSI